jgi:DNA-binding FadR family transcriptional regulator
MTARIQRRKLSHEMVDRLLARFRSGEFPPGAPLPSERQLMKQYGVGRPAVREALLSLSRMGLVAIQHGKRPVALALTVANIVGQLADLAHILVAASPKMLDQLKEARRHFEIAAVRLASQRASKAGIESLRLAVEMCSAAEPAARFEADARFHRRIAAMTGNVLFEEMSQAISALLKRYYIGWFRTEAQRCAADKGHLRILERIAAHDADGAAEAMRRHLERAATRFSVGADRRKAPAE